jgi:hypothetical protein
MGKEFQILTVCCLATIAALLVVGAVSSGVVRHLVQTSPLWIAVLFGLHNSVWSKWAALPCFVIWLLLMTATWLSLLGWVNLVSGSFSLIELTMTLIVGVASLVGIVCALAMRSSVRPWRATITVLVIAVLQLAVFPMSVLVVTH